VLVNLGWLLGGGVCRLSLSGRLLLGGSRSGLLLNWDAVLLSM